MCKNKAFYSPGSQRGRPVTKVYGHWNWIELMNYLYLVFELDHTAKTSRGPRIPAWRAIYLLPPLPLIFLPSSALNCLGDT